MRVSAELPGRKERMLSPPRLDSLTIRGEKRYTKRKKKGESYYRSERRYGSFCRVIPRHPKWNRIRWGQV